MQRLRVDSASVRSIGYDPVTAVLELEFHSGSVYRYFLVPPSVFAALRAAPSIGAFVNKCIKPRFRYVQLADWS